MSGVDINDKASYNATYHNSRFKIEEQIDEWVGEELSRVGIFLTKNNESLPAFYPVGACERVFSRKKINGMDAGARIVLTRDNYGHRATGLGGLGATKCEAIDIVAGSLSCARQLKDGSTQSRANFAEDGARLYLTERGNVNAYFATAKSETAGVSASSKKKSGVGLKADHTLIIGRERVRILAGFSKYDGGERLVNGASEIKPIIEIGATSGERHHKAVLGDNLVKYLEKMNEEIAKLNEKILNLQLDLTQYKASMAFHQHNGAGLGGIVTFPDPFFAVPEALTAVPEQINSTADSIIQEYNRKIKEIQAFGMPDLGIEGSSEHKILSSTVYIGE